MRQATAATQAEIPVDLKNPGQVLGCLGFLELAELLLGNAEAHFEWGGSPARFMLCAAGDKNPFELALDFVAAARAVEIVPFGYVEGRAADDDAVDEDTDADEEATACPGRITTPSFPSGEGDRNALPVRLIGTCGGHVDISHWADGSSRETFKLYSGNRSAHRIASQMLQGTRAKPKKGQAVGDLKTRGVAQLWAERRADLLKAPFDVLTPMGGSFNFDARGAWTAIDAGYSPNTQKDAIAASPVVELLAAIGLEHARPDEYETRRVRYAVWGLPLPPMLARVALSGADLKLPLRRFEFALDLSGKNKVSTFAREETQR